MVNKPTYAQIVRGKGLKTENPSYGFEDLQEGSWTEPEDQTSYGVNHASSDQQLHDAAFAELFNDDDFDERFNDFAFNEAQYQRSLLTDSLGDTTIVEVDNHTTFSEEVNLAMGRDSNFFIKGFPYDDLEETWKNALDKFIGKDGGASKIFGNGFRWAFISCRGDYPVHQSSNNPRDKRWTLNVCIKPAPGRGPAMPCHVFADGRGTKKRDTRPR